MTFWSASVYAVRAELVLFRVLIDFRRWAKARDASFDLWTMRYWRGGEHLKLRFRGSPKCREEISEELERQVALLLRDWPARSASTPLFLDELPPIDPEDLIADPARDRQMIWTTYRFSPAMIGGEPFPSVEGFESAYRRCLERATSFILERLGELCAGGEAEWPEASRRMGWAAELLLIGGQELFPGHGERRAFHRYLRDWLLRVTDKPLAATEVVQARAAERAGDVQSLRRRGRAASEEPSTARWREAARELRRLCLQSIGGSEVRDLGSAHLRSYQQVACRLLHNSVNPLGIGTGNEAYLSQLLAEAAVREGAASSVGEVAG